MIDRVNNQEMEEIYKQLDELLKAEFEKPARKRIEYGRMKVEQLKRVFGAIETATEMPEGREDIVIKCRAGDLELEVKRHYRWPKARYGPWAGGCIEDGCREEYEEAILNFKGKKVPAWQIKGLEDKVYQANEKIKYIRGFAPKPEEVEIVE